MIDQGGESVLLIPPEGQSFEQSLAGRSMEMCSYGNSGLADCSTAAVLGPNGVFIAYAIDDFPVDGSCRLIVENPGGVELDFSFDGLVPATTSTLMVDTSWCRPGGVSKP